MVEDGDGDLTGCDMKIQNEQNTKLKASDIDEVKRLIELYMETQKQKIRKIETSIINQKVEVKAVGGKRKEENEIILRKAYQRDKYLILFILSIAVGITIALARVNATINEDHDTRVKETASEVFEKRTERIKEKVFVINRLKENIDKIKKASIKDMHLGDDEVTFWIEMFKYRSPFAAAKRICKERGSTLAKIQRKTDYEKIMEMVREKVNERSYRYVFIGNTINPTTGEIIEPPNGFTKWADRFPILDKRYAVISLLVKHDPKQDEGMVNSSEDSYAEGVVCQI